MSLARIPCTIVTGFLGAGKTTLIRHMLQNPGGRRLAVIVNEFGDVGMDAEILRGCGAEACHEAGIIELANGCICCTVADDFVPALDALLALDPKPDHILIETSGLALPKPLVQAFHWPAIKGRVTVDGVVAVVDGAALSEGRVAADPAALAAQRAADPSLDHEDPVEEVFEDQIACADLVVMTKADLLDAKALARAHAAIAEAMPRAVNVVNSAQGQLDPGVMLGLQVAAEADIENRRTHHDGELDHDHDDFYTVVMELPEAADPAALAARVASACRVTGVLRAKGFCRVAGKSMRLLVQAVGQRVSHHYDRAWEPAEARRGRLVVIGLKGFDQAAVAKALAG
ncbi:cobalamin biosynthesis protein CobW [Roseococcus sp. SYP-B2431]|uniref:cobalamin biosynthesis protein CobW n=1 Tax=Roseococcus sp. SYP-B2431 TaxID=2496640 RepID=UPI001038D237|nr:cobalamin biosynthesis protein CobW [Roseococcus sp. SYP-B2431]TCH98171.1 cobalamin biosynthesis protein CobW [Roseococcus sp. SYP-B2431]